jgi:hypothetical protein
MICPVENHTVDSIHVHVKNGHTQTVVVKLETTHMLWHSYTLVYYSKKFYCLTTFQLRGVWTDYLKLKQ